MEKYQKRLIAEFKELNIRLMRLEMFLGNKEKSSSVGDEMLALMYRQKAGMEEYRNALAERLELLGLLDHVCEYPEVEDGEVITTDRGETFRCLSHDEQGRPIFERV